MNEEDNIAIDSWYDPEILSLISPREKLVCRQKIILAYAKTICKKEFAEYPVGDRFIAELLKNLGL